MSKSTQRLAWIGVAVVLSAACGSDAPFCGDGTLDPGEQCDDGNSNDGDFCLSTCKARQLTQLTVKWEFNKGEADGFTGDSCLDMGANMIEVELVGGPEVLVLSARCSFRQVVFSDLAPANYRVKVKVLDLDEVMLTSETFDTQYDFSGGSDSLEVVVPYGAWTKSYSGTFYFKTAWAGADCTSATPAVAQQKLKLVVGGQTYSGSTKAGVSLDGGSGSVSACVSNGETFPQSALSVPYGPANFTVQGIDAGGSVVYEKEFATFVGAGVNNPEYLFDVPAALP